LNSFSFFYPLKVWLLFLLRFHLSLSFFLEPTTYIYMLTHISFLVIRTSTYTHFDLWEKRLFNIILTSGKKRFFNVIIIWEKRVFWLFWHLGKKDYASGKKRHSKKCIWEKKTLQKRHLGKKDYAHFCWHLGKKDFHLGKKIKPFWSSY